MNNIKQAIKDLQQGKMVLVVDDEQRENEGDLVIAAEKVTPEAINFMIRQAGGLICLAMAGYKIDQLQLEYMRPRQTDDMTTGFTVSIEARTGVTTGVSAHDRAHTIQVAAKADATPADIVVPGHVFPLRARDNGVLERPGHTEAAVDLMQLAGLEPAAAICEIMAADGSMLRGEGLRQFAQQHQITLVSMHDLITYRQTYQDIATEKSLHYRMHPSAACELKTAYGTFTLQVFRDSVTQQEHIALIYGNLSQAEKPLVRVHSCCLTGDVFSSLHCDCGEQLHSALQKIAQAGNGVLIYLEQEGRGIGLTNKVQAYALQQQGHNTVSANLALGLPADARDYAIAAEMLQQLDVRNFQLLTNNPQKLATLAKLMQVDIERVPHQVIASIQAQDYLKVKRDALGHWLDV
jgi:3,4-dihydroxy 2-butanone 4-phosphate synthase/GTP cyclohydrolase II